MILRGEDRTDWARLNALTEEELEASIDYDDEGEFDLSTAQAGMPALSRPVTVYIDAAVIEWFEAQESGYETKMNAALRAHVHAHKR